MLAYAQPITRLITALHRLPGIGPKTAQRLAFYLLSAPETEARELAEALLEARAKTHYCSQCSDLTDVDPCRICSDTGRDRAVICVVEEPRDVVAIERTREYRGLYHVLHGALSPIDGVGPDALKIKELLARLQNGEIREIVVATDADTEGEATALYLARLIKPLRIKVTRLAYGLPVGGDLEYADEITLGRALAGRYEIAG